MKSAHRHELQTNALAQRLDAAIQRLRPFVSTITGVIVAIAIAMLIWSYMTKSSATRQDDAWNAYNQVIGSAFPDLDELQQKAEEFPGTKMQELANMTWADGQVFNAAQSYIYNRRVATDALNRATSAYQGILQTSDDERLHDRAHLGLARVYEMRNELGKARDEYLAVRGGYAEYAKTQAERLAKPEAQDTYAWLDKAVPPRVQPLLGPGTPGQRPEFDANDLSLPEAALEAGVPAAMPPEVSTEDLLKGLGDLQTDIGKRGESDQPPPSNPESQDTPLSTPGTEGAAPSPETPPPSDGAAPAADGASSTESDSAPPADPTATPPSSASPTTEEKSAE